MISWTQHERTMTALHRVSARRQDLSFVVKLHRGDRREHWEGTRVAGSRLQILDPKVAAGTTIMDWIAEACVLLTGASTAGTEAMLAHVPVVTMDFCEELGDTDFIRAGATTHVKTLEQLESALDRILREGQDAQTQERAERYLDDFFFGRDGRAAERCADAIEDLTARPSRDPPDAVVFR
jgi:UDP-N-acetylglucosamine 2-epimerase